MKSMPTISRRWMGSRSATTARRKPSAHQASRRPHRSTDAREHEALRQQLTDEPRASRAKRGADRKLAVTRRRPSEEQVGDVCAGDQENKRHGGGEHDECRADVAGQLLAQRHDARPSSPC